MTPDDFWTELRDSLTSFYEGVLKVPGAGGRPQPKIIKRRFTTKLCFHSFRILCWVLFSGADRGLCASGGRGGNGNRTPCSDQTGNRC
jgi:hypothetical protein